MVDCRVGPEAGGGRVDDRRQLDRQAIGLPRSDEETRGARALAAIPPGTDVAQTVGEEGEGLEAKRAIHRAAPMLDPLRRKGGREIVFGKVIQLHPGLPSEGIVVPIVGDDPAGQHWYRRGQERQQICP